MRSVKDDLRLMAEKLSDEATWEDVMYEAYIRDRIARGIAQGDEGKTIPFDEVRKKLLGQ